MCCGYHSVVLLLTEQVVNRTLRGVEARVQEKMVGKRQGSATELRCDVFTDVHFYGKMTQDSFHNRRDTSVHLKTQNFMCIRQRILLVTWEGHGSRACPFTLLFFSQLLFSSWTDMNPCFLVLLAWEQSLPIRLGQTPFARFSIWERHKSQRVQSTQRDHNSFCSSCHSTSIQSTHATHQMPSSSSFSLQRSHSPNRMPPWLLRRLKRDRESFCSS